MIDIELTEEDVRAKYIDPSIRNAGWNEELQIRREVFFTDGKIIIQKNKTKRGKRKKAEYMKKYKNNIPFSVKKGYNTYILKKWRYLYEWTYRFRTRTDSD